MDLPSPHPTPCGRFGSPGQALTSAGRALRSRKDLPQGQKALPKPIAFPLRTKAARCARGLLLSGVNAVDGAEDAAGEDDDGWRRPWGAGVDGGGEERRECRGVASGQVQPADSTLLSARHARSHHTPLHLTAPDPTITKTHARKRKRFGVF